MAKTTVLKPADVSRSWFVIDASTAPLGRVASLAAKKLIGKDSPMYTPHVDSGAHIVIINAKDLVVTGNKELQKKYYSHSQYPGSLKETTLKAQVEKNPAKVLEAAIYGMLPKNKLRSGRMARLKVYADDQHNHAAQKPVNLKVGKA